MPATGSVSACGLGYFRSFPVVGWGRPKKNAGTSAPSKAAKKKRNLSPEGRARIAEAIKQRWAKLKAKGKQSSNT